MPPGAGLRSALATAILVALPACALRSGEPGAGRSPDPTPLPVESVVSESYSVSDERVTKDELAGGGIYWFVTFDAAWDGSGEPYEARCIWKTYDPTGTLNARDSRTIDGPGDDIRIGEIYPDEVPGVPVEARVACAAD